MAEVKKEKTPAMQTQKLKVFIVDDDLFALHLFAQFTRNLGISQVSTFVDAETCLAALDENPDVVIVDYYLQGMNGLALLEKIKIIQPAVYVVLATSEVNEQVARQSLVLGAFDYVIKGVGARERLEAILNRIVSITEMLARLGQPLYPRN